MNNREVARRWARQLDTLAGPDSGRSSNGNFSFAGRILFSYSTPIGRIDPTRRVALLWSEAATMTTKTKHLSPALSECCQRGMEIFWVPDVQGSPAATRYWFARTLHDATAAHARAKASGRKPSIAKAYLALTHRWETSARFCDAFGLDRLPEPEPDVESEDAVVLMAERRVAREAKRRARWATLATV